jgi:hypothetical protein
LLRQCTFQKGRAAIHEAAVLNHVEVVVRFLSAGTDPYLKTMVCRFCDGVDQHAAMTGTKSHRVILLLSFCLQQDGKTAHDLAKTDEMRKAVEAGEELGLIMRRDE